MEREKHFICTQSKIHFESFLYGKKFKHKSGFHNKHLHENGIGSPAEKHEKRNSANIHVYPPVP